ncbi:MAG: signal recognition particle protein [Candidatus Kapabacteria bacterium]|nr:signal recognition particle protein [Candidatus Kapabacteria bacterium]MCS7169521.1 signal recognition particle protein [Candidatus Kapabacteria bacterium]MDW7996302.1 signal recognition particle protein [Bacteroidota bacterium]MDW8225260.1 signal recognition particle protein [Bacteroidota bacterium]
MFEQLTEGLQAVFRRLRGVRALRAAELEEPLQELRRSLLEADVHVQVVREFVERVRLRAQEVQLPPMVMPDQFILKLVYEELVSLLGKQWVPLRTARKPPTSILLVGLQGSGKTTTAAKLAFYLRRQGRHPLLTTCDLRRPAALRQLESLASEISVPTFYYEGAAEPEQVAAAAIHYARLSARDVVIFDTAGRLAVDCSLMQELKRLREQIHPEEVLFVCDAMGGQDVLPTARAFHEAIGLTGIVLTKLDGDARGGAALSLRSATDVPIKFFGTGERPDALEPFHPERIASRILDMGDVATLVERLQQQLVAANCPEMAAIPQDPDELDFEILLRQLRSLRQMGPLSELLCLLPGSAQWLKSAQLNPKSLARAEAIILSMTPEERRNPRMLNASRRRRIARGSGTTVQDVNRLLANLEQMQKLFRKWKRGRMPLDLRESRSVQ